jgi:hypothetical protein
MNNLIKATKKFEDFKNWEDHQIRNELIINQNARN